jgi:hypothetical protein
MKYNFKLILLLCIFTVFFIFFPSLIYAQSVDCPDVVDPDYPCPIDGGVSALLAIGIFYGVKKVFDTRKK